MRTELWIISLALATALATTGCKQSEAAPASTEPVLIKPAHSAKRWQPVSPSEAASLSKRWVELWESLLASVERDASCAAIAGTWDQLLVARSNELTTLVAASARISSAHLDRLEEQKDQIRGAAELIPRMQAASARLEPIAERCRHDAAFQAALRKLTGTASSGDHGHAHP